MAVYLIHLERRLNPARPARHYLGWACDVAARLAEHRAGAGAKMLAAANARGIGYDVARVWPAGDRKLERQLKRRKEGPSLCPLCRKDGSHAH